MIIDTLHSTFSEDQAVTVTAISTNVMELNETGIVYGETAQLTRELGPGVEIPLLIQVTTTFLTLTSLTITLETADNAALSTNPVVLYSTGAVPVASLVAGYKVPVRVFPNGALKDFLGVRYTVTGDNATAGKITAALTMGVEGGHQ